MLIQHTSMQTLNGSAGFADSSFDFPVEIAVFGYNVPEVFEVVVCLELYLFSHRDRERRSGGARTGLKGEFNLPQADGLAKKIDEGFHKPLDNEPEVSMLCAVKIQSSAGRMLRGLAASQVPWS